MTALDAPPLTTVLLERLDGGVLLLDAEHRVRCWNAWLRRASGLDAGELLGRPLWEALPALRDARLRAAVEDALAAGAASVLTHGLHGLMLPLRGRDGEPLLHDLTVERLVLPSGAHVLVQVKDVTERRRAQVALLESRRRYRAIFERAAIGIGEADLAGHFLEANETLCSLLGYRRAELLGMSFEDVTHPEDLAHNRALLERVRAGAVPCLALEKRYVRKDGIVFWGHLSAALIASEDGPARFVATLEDISARRQAEAERQTQLAHKDLLMREVHHRVKNSLTLVASLLTIQNRRTRSPIARAQLVEAYQRVLAIAQVHERLYKGSNPDRVALGALLRGLCGDLERSVAAFERGHQVVAEIGAEAELPVETALPLALVVSELVTNAFKHAHPDGGFGVVTVRCALRGPGRLRVSVADDGSGLPPGFDPARGRSLGMRIVTSLCQQLGAELEVRSTDAGAEFALEFQA